MVALAVAALVLAGCSDDDSSDESTSTSEAASSGSTGLTTAEITQLQEDLAKVGCYEGAFDGEEGPETLAAITAFQEAEGLAVDDVVGPDTQSALTTAVDEGRTVCSGSGSGTTSTTSASTGSNSSSGTAAPASTEPPCTDAALLPVAQARDANATAVDGTQCAQGADGTWWAVYYPVTSGEGGIEFTSVAKADGGSWVYAGGNDICSELPSSLQTPCNTN